MGQKKPLLHQKQKSNITRKRPCLSMRKKELDFLGYMVFMERVILKYHHSQIFSVRKPMYSCTNFQVEHQLLLSFGPMLCHWDLRIHKEDIWLKPFGIFISATLSLCILAYTSCWMDISSYLILQLQESNR